MGAADTRKVVLFSVLILLVLGGPLLWADSFHVGKHEGDTVHLADILGRLSLGYDLHHDIMTPIGILAFAPMHWLGAGGLGLGMGQSMLAAQVLVAALVLPAALWVGLSRMGTACAVLFAGVAVVFCVALVHGGLASEPSISMHYNRWAWAVSFCAILVAVLPPVHRVSARADGLIVGAALAFLALSKVTYFVAFAPGIALALVLRRDWAAMGWAMGTGLAAALAVTVWLGVGYWPAYVADLLAVSGSEVRPNPGGTLATIAGAPSHLAVTLAGLGAAVVLRQSGHRPAGLVMLVLVPGFIYVTYQNYGNDPQWIVLLPFILLALFPAAGARNGLGWDMRLVATGLCAAAVALAAPGFLNMATSPIRHAQIAATGTTELIPGRPDLRTDNPRAYSAIAKVPLAVEGARLARFAAHAELLPATQLQGEALPYCKQEMGLKAGFQAMAQDLEAAGFGGSGIFMADILNAIWLYGDFRPLRGGAPWYYDGLPGWQDADYLAVPLCPGANDVRRAVLRAFETEGVALREVWRNEALVLLERMPGEGQVAGLTD